MKFSTDGTLIGDFPMSGVLDPGSRLVDFEILPRGKVLIAGDFETLGGHESPKIARLNSDGSVDTAFTMASPLTGTVSEIGAFRDGRMGVVGSFTEIGGLVADNLAVLGPDGGLQPDVTFPDKFRDYGQEFVAGHDNALYLDSRGNSDQTFPVGPIIRLRPDGTLDRDLGLPA